ncbi:hypothetical protein C8R44DRAFT_742527 [Mycena epipterygia]|nr:hypothetical protein C8R44DRAFT_742527 [Mycena epipterygia]
MSSDNIFPRSQLFPEPAAKAHIRDLLRSNSQPPHHLSSTISALSDELARHDIELSRLRAQLTAVEADHAALKAYYDDCRGLSSATRRLPAETLLEIFGYISEDPPWLTVDRCDSPEAAMANLAQAHLLAVSQVCMRWHRIAMGTPALWTSIWLDSIIWSTPALADKAMVLLQTVLNRGGTSLLDIALAIYNGSAHIPALDLIAAHSERWQTARFVAWAPGLLDNLWIVKGRLPQLHTLSLCGSVPLEHFQDAPLLKDVTFSGLPDATMALVRLPLRQLDFLQCAEFVGLAERFGLGVSPALRVLPHLSKTARFNLELFYIDGGTPFDEYIVVPPVTAEIATLSIMVANQFQVPSNAGTTIAKMIDALTLPALREMAMDSQDYPAHPLPWPHAQFLALSTRSSFNTTLRSLELWCSIITEAELLECLAALPRLDHLAISDHQLTAQGGADQLLITDSLLARLTWPPHSPPPLVPRLGSFHCRSRLQFTDTVFLEFIDSRLDNRYLFESEIWALPGNFRKIDPVVSDRLQVLCNRHLLVFSLFSST